MENDLRLLEMSIHRFRGFVGQDRPPLSFGDVTVLVGANGHGKTTVFDAIDWTLFGDAWRWAKSDTDVTRGLRRPDEVPAVTIRFQNGATHTLVRNGEKVTWDGSSFDPSFLSRNESVFVRTADLVRALRSIVYLPQEHLRGLVGSGSANERHSMLAALAGVPFADRFEKNFKNTRDDLEARRRAVLKDLEQVADRRRELELQLADLRRLRGFNSALMDRVSAFLGEQPIDVVALREAVARRIEESKRLEAQSTEKAANALKLATELEHLAPTEERERTALARAIAEQAEVQKRLTEAIDSERALANEQSQKSEAVRTLEPLAEEARLSFQVAERRQNIQQSILSLRNSLDQSKTRSVALSAAVAETCRAFDHARSSVSEATAELEKAQNDLEQANRRLALLSRQKNLQAQLEELETQSTAAESTRVTSIEAATQAREREAGCKSKVSELRLEIKRSLKNAERVAQVIGELLTQQHADDATCLVCGHNHGDGPTRLSAMQHQLQRLSAATGLAQQLGSAEAQLAGATSDAKNLESRMNEAIARSSHVSGEQSRIEIELRTVGAQLQDYKVQEQPHEYLAHRVEELAGLVQAQKTSASSKQREAEEARAALASERDNAIRLERDLSAAIAEAGTESPIEQAAVAELQRACEDSARAVAAMRAQIEVNVGMLRMRSGDIMTLRDRLVGIERSADAGQKRVDELAAKVTAVKRQVGLLRISTAADTATILVSLRDLASREDADARLRGEDAAKGQALAHDLAAIKSVASMDVVERNLVDLSARDQTLTIRSESVGRAAIRLDEISAAVRKAMADAATGAIKGAEDRINEILSDLCPHQHLNVLRLAEDGVLRATDVAGSPRVSPEYYGSTGQLGCMGLSVFLGIALGQRWSRLNVLLLDEPVQNMDDVNFVRFLDLIRRLAETHQVVVSTADKNIGELLRRKLALWANGRTRRALVHRFEAFDVETGPTIVSEEINRLRAVSA